MPATDRVLTVGCRPRGGSAATRLAALWPTLPGARPVTDPSPESPAPSDSWEGMLAALRRRYPGQRDSVLFCSKQLDENIGGPSMDPQQPDARRRTIYSEVSRFKLNPMLALFDFPDANVHSARRIETTTPIQKLFTMNHPLMTRQSKLLVQWLFEEAGAKLDDRVETLYWSLFSRAPEDVEIDIARQFLGPEQAGDQEAWIQYAQGLLASNEMLFLD